MYSVFPEPIYEKLNIIVPKEFALFFHTPAEINLSDLCGFSPYITIFIGLIMENISAFSCSQMLHGIASLNFFQLNDRTLGFHPRAQN